MAKGGSFSRGRGVEERKLMTGSRSRSGVWAWVGEGECWDFWAYYLLGGITAEEKCGVSRQHKGGLVGAFLDG